MTLHELIFTERPLERSYRHIVFWSVRYLFLLTSSWMNTHLISDLPIYSLPRSLFQVGLDMSFEMGYTYTIAYYLVPRLFLRKKYWQFAVAVIASTFLTILLSEAGRHFSQAAGRFYLSFFSLWGTFWGYTGYGPPSICVLFLVIRMLKLYYKKMEEKEVLIRETANAESQLLKARVHPHFLFNTLNNIYSYSYDRPADAVGLAESLSGTMRYMIRDCEASLVPLEKELKMIEDYIQLEKVRYGNRLSVTISIDGDRTGKMVAPLLMIPFVENAFKHGASQMMEGSWIKLRIFIRDTVLQMDVSNNKPFRPMLQNEKGGIGLSTVRKRLELLYPGSHLLTIDPTPEMFRTLVQVPLQPITAQPHDHVK
jgi:hypothetical protein